MGSSLIRYAASQRTSGDQQLFWGRIHQDGLPFRGHGAPMLTEDEFETRVNRVADAKNGFFDTHNPAENAKFLQICEAACNGWYRIVYLERFWRKTTKHYVEWVEYYLEDGNPTPYSQQGLMELAHGSGDFAGHSATNQGGT